MGKTQELAVSSSAEFPLAPVQVEAMREIVRDNLGDSQIRPFDLERIKVPGSGGKFWTILDQDGTEKPVSTFDAIILHQSACRQYYATDDISGQPPDCYSDDMRVGIGTPGGECAACPLNEWKSGKGGIGKACAEKKKMFLLMPGRIMPAFLMVPTGSLKGVTGYMLRTLTTRQIPFYGAITTFGLAEKKSAAGIAYSAIELRLKEILSPEQRAQVSALRDSMSPLFANVSARNPEEQHGREPGEEG